MSKLQVGVTISFWVFTLLFVWSLAGNYVFEKELTYTTPCILPNKTSEFQNVNELYGSNGLPWDIPEQPDEIDRLKQSCLAWQHGYNFLNGTVLPYTILIIFLIILRFRGDNWKKIINPNYKEEFDKHWKPEHKP